MKNKQSIFVAGASGFLGSAIAKALANKNYEIFALSRYKPNYYHKNIQWIIVDLKSKPSYELYIRQCDKIFYAASATTPAAPQTAHIEKGKIIYSRFSIFWS